MRIKTVLLAATLPLLLAACEQREEGVYGEDLPAYGDDSAFAKIYNQLEGEDAQLWRNVMVRMGAADEVGVDARSVREAIENERARIACQEATDDITEQVACSDRPI